jgi:hypothetical protein
MRGEAWFAREHEGSEVEAPFAARGDPGAVLLNENIGRGHELIYGRLGEC